MAVQHIISGILDGVAVGNALPAGVDLVDREEVRPDRGLGGTAQSNKVQVGERPFHGWRQGQGNPVAAVEYQPQMGAALAHGRQEGHQLEEGGGGRVPEGDAAGLNQVDEDLGILEIVLEGDEDRGSGGEGAKDIVDGEVKTKGGEEEQAIVSAHLPGLIDPLDEVDHGGMLQHNALGSAGGTTGENDIGDLKGGNIHLRSAATLLLQWELIQTQDPCLHRRQIPGQSIEGDEVGGLDILKNEGFAVQRVLRVERHVGGPGFEHAQQTPNQFQATGEADTNPVPGSDPFLNQVIGQLIGAGLDLVITQAGIAVIGSAVDRRYGIGTAIDLSFEKTMEGLVLGVGCIAVIPVHQQLLLFDPGKNLQPGIGAIQILRQGRQHLGEMTSQPIGRGRIEQGRIVVQDRIQRIGCFQNHQVQVEMDKIPLDVVLADTGPVQTLCRPAQVLIGEHHLKQRVPAHIPLGLQFLYQFLKGHILVGVGVQGHVLDPLEQLFHRGVAGQIDPEHEGIGKVADQGLELAAVAVGDRGPDEDILLTTVMAQQGSIGGGQDLVQGNALGGGRLFQPAGQIGGEGDGSQSPFIADLFGAMAIGGQLEGGGAGQLFAPVGQLFGQDDLGKMVLLPPGKIAVLDRQWHQLRFLSPGQGIIGVD